MRPAPTEDQLRRLASIATMRKQVANMVVLVAPSLFLISLALQSDTLKMALAVGALVIVAGATLYISFGLRCPRCKGWIAMPKCPACGLALEKPAKP